MPTSSPGYSALATSRPQLELLLEKLNYHPDKARQAIHNATNNSRRFAPKYQSVGFQKRRWSGLSRQHISFNQCHYSAVAVHCDGLPAANAFGTHAGSQHGGHAVFPRHNRTVTERAAHIRNNA